MFELYVYPYNVHGVSPKQYRTHEEEEGDLGIASFPKEQSPNFIYRGKPAGPALPLGLQEFHYIVVSVTLGQHQWRFVVLI